jgi:hypothetical protein
MMSDAMTYWCLTCRKRHEPTAEHPLCQLARGLHDIIPPDKLWFDYRGWIFRPPFYCMSCGVEVCERQWAYSRTCGSCDVSNSRTARRLPGGSLFAGPHEPGTKTRNDIPISGGRFLDPATREQYPVKNPRSDGDDD